MIPPVKDNGVIDEADRARSISSPLSSIARPRPLEPHVVKRSRQQCYVSSALGTTTAGIASGAIAVRRRISVRSSRVESIGRSAAANRWSTPMPGIAASESPHHTSGRPWRVHSGMPASRSSDLTRAGGAIGSELNPLAALARADDTDRAVARHATAMPRPRTGTKSERAVGQRERRLRRSSANSNGAARNDGRRCARDGARSRTRRAEGGYGRRCARRAIACDIASSRRGRWRRQTALTQEPPQQVSRRDVRAMHEARRATALARRERPSRRSPRGRRSAPPLRPRVERRARRSPDSRTLRSQVPARRARVTRCARSECRRCFRRRQNATRAR